MKILRLGILQNIGFKKLLLVGLLVLTVFPSFISTSSAQVNNYEAESALSEHIHGNDYCIEDPQGGDPNCPQNTNLVSNLAQGAIDLFVPQDKILLDSEGNPSKTAGGADIYIRRPGAIGSMLNLEQQMYDNPPASGIVYAQTEWKKITEGHTAYAATNPQDTWIYYPGLGFNVLNPVQGYWTVSRNIAYLAMIIVMVIVAFLVAFRGNFGGQTQVTIANSIPNIVLALVMISLSYPLSGFAIDIVTIGSNLAQQVLVQNTFSPGYEDVWTAPEIDRFVTVTSGAPTKSPLQEPQKHLQPDDTDMSVWHIFATSDINLIEKRGDTSIVTLVPDQGFIGGIIENILKDAAESGIGHLFFQLVFIIAAFMASLKLFLKLLSKYLTLVLYPFISPFVMLTIAIPGQGTKAIMGYFKTLLAASLSFVAVYTLFLFMIVLGHDSNFEYEVDYVPPLLGYRADSTDIGSYVKTLLAFGLFLASPAIPDMVEQAVGNINPQFQDMSAARRAQVTTKEGFYGGIGRAQNLLGWGWKNAPINRGNQPKEPRPQQKA